tara:strand:- start:1372 stop:1980 length:609 start_codon:yes stop_codon:yes gene_type:complete
MSEYSIYPKAVDGYSQIPLVIDRLTPVKAEGVNRLRSAIINVETTLGIAPHISDHEEVFVDVNERLDDIESCFDFDLDRAYDGRGIRSRDPTVRGSGRLITADSGAVRITNSNSNTTNSLEIIRDNDTMSSSGEKSGESRAVYISGNVQTLGITDSYVHANPQGVEADLTVYGGINALLVGDISIPVGITLEIEDTANLLIL